MEIVWIVLGMRFGAFLLEILVDIAVDIQLHNDIVKLSLKSSERNICNGTPANANLNMENIDVEAIENTEAQPIVASKFSFKKYFSVGDSVRMNPDIEYIGSIFTWGAESVFDGSHVWKTVRFPSSYTVCLCLLPLIPAVLVFVPLATLCLAAGVLIGILLLLVSLLTCNRSFLTTPNYWKELLHF